MRVLYAVLVAGLVAGCAADPAKVQQVAEEEAERLAPASRPLSTFANFELAPMTMSDGILADEKKVREAQEFETQLVAKLNPLLQEWNSAGSEGASGTLEVRTNMQRLRVISGGARFWAGALAGDSFIDLDLVLVDKDSGEEIANVPVRRDANAMTGAWSVGKSDQNLDAYVVTIIHQYLSDNY